MIKSTTTAAMPLEKRSVKTSINVFVLFLTPIGTGRKSSSSDALWVVYRKAPSAILTRTPVANAGSRTNKPDPRNNADGRIAIAIPTPNRRTIRAVSKSWVRNAAQPSHVKNSPKNAVLASLSGKCSSTTNENWLSTVVDMIMLRAMTAITSFR